MIRALIFDFDGLILDTESPDFSAWQEEFRRHGRELTLSAWAHCIGVPAGVFDPTAHLEALLGAPIDRESVRTRHRRRFHEILDAQGPRPGVRDYLKAARRLGLQRAVASSASREWVEGHLGRLGLLDSFVCLRCCGDAPRAKPHPDLYLAAVDALGVAPQESIAFEDSPNGIRAARAAGLHVVAVPNTVTRQLDLEEADLVLDSMEAMPLEHLLAHLEGRAA